ncbi:MAG: macro domain-containing protein [candidate division KSB1 bacterium]|nr:macro domain-containing protein [candidate division KSB1 bacterium]MDQ7066263.1 macro domain-containing protein [candidate division KSB1 bacterium]
MDRLPIKDSVIRVVEGDITEQETDAIVNPASSQLILGGGVAGAIRRKGGRRIQEECNRIGGTPVGTAVLTTGGKLKARWVIHAVGPRMGEGDEDAKLRSATVSSLKLADDHGMRSLTFPAISTGIFGYPMDRCADIMLHTVAEYLQGKTGLKEVRFCLWGREAYAIFANTLQRVADELKA